MKKILFTLILLMVKLQVEAFGVKLNEKYFCEPTAAELLPSFRFVAEKLLLVQLALVVANEFLFQGLAVKPVATAVAAEPVGV
jgi:hypothetical protein